MKRFRRGLVVKAHRLLYHSTLGSRVIKKRGYYMAMMLFILSAPWRASSEEKGSENPAAFIVEILACERTSVQSLVVQVRHGRFQVSC